MTVQELVKALKENTQEYEFAKLIASRLTDSIQKLIKLSAFEEYIDDIKEFINNPKFLSFCVSKESNDEEITLFVDSSRGLLEIYSADSSDYVALAMTGQETFNVVIKDNEFKEMEKGIHDQVIAIVNSRGDIINDFYKISLRVIEKEVFIEVKDNTINTVIYQAISKKDL